MEKLTMVDLSNPNSTVLGRMPDKWIRAMINYQGPIEVFTSRWVDKDASESFYSHFAYRKKPIGEDTRAFYGKPQDKDN